MPFKSSRIKKENDVSYWDVILEFRCEENDRILWLLEVAVGVKLPVVVCVSELNVFYFLETRENDDAN
jgi:hypothetical protein